MAFDDAISDMPKASVNVNTAGRPSGMAATASETAVMNVSTRATPFASSKIKIAIQTTIAIADSTFPSFVTLSSSGVASSFSCMILAISPIWVFIPIRSTTPRA